MCCVETKNKIYEEFNNGLTPQQVIVKLNIPEEKKVVYGCYTYFKNNKKNNDKKLLNEELERSNELVENQKSTIISIAESGRMLIDVIKEINQINLTAEIEEFSFLRQVLLHDVENGKKRESVVDDIEIVSNIRRNYKNIEYIMQKINKSKRELNQLVTLFEGILSYFKANHENGTDIFIKTREGKMSDHCLDLLSELR